MTANCDGSPRRSQSKSLSRKATVCSGVKAPSENRMKSVFAISGARKSTSSWRKGRRMRRAVSRVILVGAIDLNRLRAVRANRPYLSGLEKGGHYNMKTMNDRVSIHNRDADEDG